MNAQAQTGSKHEGRDERGRFTKGNRGGPGNPFARQVAQLRRDLIKEYSQNATFSSQMNGFQVVVTPPKNLESIHEIS